MKAVREQISYHFSTQVNGQVCNQVEYPSYNQVQKQIREKIYHLIWFHVQYHISDQIEEQLRAAKRRGVDIGTS